MGLHAYECFVVEMVLTYMTLLVYIRHTRDEIDYIGYCISIQ